MPQRLRVSTRNARFQQWEALLDNRNKRHRSGEFLVQGVRPITMAVAHRWPLRALLYASDRPLSRWASALVDDSTARRVAMTSELLAVLGGKAAEPPELVAVAATRADDLDRISVGDPGLVVVFDRPTQPGNLGTLVRSADAFGATGVIVTGHAADIYDPRTVRASTGSLFAVPTVNADSPHDVVAWLRAHRLHLVGTDESGSTRIDQHDLTGPTAVVVGNETSGLSAAWRDACTDLVSIPIGGAASSLNAAAAGVVVLYEAARQRGFATTE
ncbi:MAG: TrmH family RNA methyltransferase [Nocardioidaceae bacterium]